MARRPIPGIVTAMTRTGAPPARRRVIDTYQDGDRFERFCFLLAAALITSGVVHLGVFVVDGGPWSGPISWRKAVTFGVTFGVVLAVLVAVTRYARVAPGVRRSLLGGFAAASVMEVVAITVQAWRQVRSQTVGTSGLDVALGRSGAVFGAVIIVTVVGLALATIRPASGTRPSMRLALATGYLGLLVGLGIGVTMIVRSVIAADGAAEIQINAVGVSLVPAHLVSMSGVVLLPAIAWIVSPGPGPERRRVAIVGLAVVGHLLLAGVVVGESFAGIDPLIPAEAPVPATLLATLGIVTLLSAAGAAALERAASA